MLLRLASWIPHLALAGMTSLLLFAVGRPIRTADLWLHLALGRAYAAQGPWLDADPLLYTATAPPAAAAWLTDLALHGVWLVGGFQGLRVVHVLGVVAILALAFGLLRRAASTGGNANGGALALPLASLGSMLLIVLGGYRFLQLRPHLVTIFCVLLLYRLVLESREPLSTRRIALGVLLLGVWANAHAGFVLGPVLAGAALIGVLLEASFRTGGERDAAWRRARGLALVLAAGIAVTFLNPDGATPHLSYFRAGTESPALSMVLDEWRPFPFFGPLYPGLPPFQLNFGLGWALLVAAPVLGATALLRLRRSDALLADPALVGVACAGALAAAISVRFQWLGIFTLLLALSMGCATLARRRERFETGVVVTLAATALLALPLWVHLGEWPRLKEDVPLTPARYAEPYSAAHYHGHATWFLLDARVEGHLFNRYVLGNYLGYWLSPRLQPFFGGSLNVPPAVADAHQALNDRKGQGDMSFEETLDHYEVDVFLGIGAPIVASDARPQVYTASHLEGVAGWVPIFRNIRSSIWLRRNLRNAANLERVADYYRAAGVPFDSVTGFDAGRALDAAPDWAVEHGLVPGGYPRLRAAVASNRPVAMRRLATVYAALGLYDRAVALDREILRHAPAIDARRRLIFSLLHQGRGAEALAAAEHFEAGAPQGTLARRLAKAARAYADAGTAGERAEIVAELRFLALADAPLLFTGVRDAAPR